ncbi:hypothetical protein BGX38DRAFT_1276575 [Terfezia claveryi]|nr:hypothetical protein BGX38DRAFT_1276575 [Terfezia claveryi]
MVTPKNLIQNSKTDLGWDTRDADYTSWRNAVKDYCAQHSIRSWASASQNEKDALIIAARSLTGFRTSMRNRLAGGSESHQKALEALLQDCLKKRSETSKNLAIKRARKRAHAHENSDEEEDISDAGEAAGTAVAFWVCDPEIGEHRDINGWIWDERDRRNLVVIQTKTLDGIWDMVKAHVPADRKVREILGAPKDPNPPNLSFPADYTSLHSDTEVKAFFRMSKSDPFIPRNEYEDFAEDFDANIRNVAGVRRRQISTRDHTFEQCKYELRGRVDRQQETLSDIKKEHKRLFPNAGIIDSDDEDYCYIRYLKRPKITSGPQLVKARQVVAVGHRATRLNRLLGVRRVVRKVRGLNAAQYHWRR